MILIGDEPDALARNLQDRFPNAHLIGVDREYDNFVARVLGSVDAPGFGLDLPLDVRGTAFQQRVWRALQDFPIGHTVSYAKIARRIGAPKATRAVAGACAANNLAIAIHCHRVVKKRRQTVGLRMGRRTQASANRTRNRAAVTSRAICQRVVSIEFMKSLFDAIPSFNPAREVMGEDAVLLRARALPVEPEFLSAIHAITAQAQFRQMTTPGSFIMSVAMTNCGMAGWVIDRTGYRYDPIDPNSGRPWPAMPDCFLQLATDAAVAKRF